MIWTYSQEDYYKPVIVDNFRNNFHTEYESNGNNNKNLSVKEYLHKIIKIYLSSQGSDMWKIQLIIAITYIFSRDVNEECVMHSKGNNIELMSYDNVNEVVHEFFESLLLRYQSSLETSVRGSNFLFNSVLLLYYKGSYMDSPGLMKHNKW